jgi:RNA polymerase sigma-70 factor (ECF subfamily)
MRAPLNAATDRLDDDDRRAPDRTRALQDREEQAWIARIRAGDSAAFEAMFHAYFEPLWAFLVGYVEVPEIAEELTQDILCRIWEERARWTVRDSLRSYLYGAARNKAMGYLRHRQVVRQWQVRAVQEPRTAGIGVGPAATDDRLRSRELAAAFAAAVARLPERRRLAYTLQWQHGLSLAEIARTMGVTVKCVELQLAAASKTLSKELAHFF